MRGANPALTVSQLNAYVKQVLWKDELLRQVSVRGELANLRNYGGHLYFTLKDEKASVKAVMWRSDAGRLAFVPTEGAEVRAEGNVSVFERDGVYQVYVSYMEPSGLGALYARLEMLKKKLEAEGLFSQERKRPLPGFPRKIGLVTSTRGAAIRDIVSVGRRRYKGVAFVVVDARVQGEGASDEVARGIQVLNQIPEVDVIIIGRGGGSQEDLFVFNDETLARAIYGSRVPVVSAVGHERDITVADLVADARAATPSQASEMAVPNAVELLEAVRSLEDKMGSQVLGLIKGHRQRLELIRSRPALHRPDWFLVSSKESLVRLRQSLDSAMQMVLERSSVSFSHASSRLHALSPLQILGRGFSLSRRVSDGAILKSSEDAPPGTKVEITLSKGSLDCVVERAKQ